MEEGQEPASLDEMITLFSKIKTLYETVNKLQEVMKQQQQQQQQQDPTDSTINSPATPEPETDRSLTTPSATEMEEEEGDLLAPATTPL
jgi:hypothetical protein